MKRQKSKRANGEGTFYQLEDKSWVHQITIGMKPDGKPNRKSYKGPTRAICIERKNAYLEKQANLQRLEQEAEKQSELKEQEAANAQKKYKLVDNPTVGTQRPEIHTPPMRVLTQEEMTIFIKEVMRETQRIAILFDLFTGLRKGELLALHLDDLDLEKQTIRVRRNIIRVRTDSINLEDPNIEILNYHPDHKTQMILQNTPKTKTSFREVPLSDGLCELVVRHIFTMQSSSWPNPNNLLFLSKTGTYIDPKSFEIRLNAVSKRCEIKKVNPHALRHTLATRLVEENVPLQTVKDILGHASITTTQIYTHGNVELEQAAITEVSSCLDFQQLDRAPRLNGAKKRMKYADVVIPDFSKAEPALKENGGGCRPGCKSQTKRVSGES